MQKIPGFVYWVAFAVIYAGLQAFVVAQWPEVQPAWVIGIMTGLGVLAGIIKAFWPTPPIPAAPTARGLAEPPPQPSKVQRFLF